MLPYIIKLVYVQKVIIFKSNILINKADVYGIYVQVSQSKCYSLTGTLVSEFNKYIHIYFFTKQLYMISTRSVQHITECLHSLTHSFQIQCNILRWFKKTLKNIYCHSLSIKYKAICLQNEELSRVGATSLHKSYRV